MLQNIKLKMYIIVIQKCKNLKNYNDKKYKN